MFSPICFTNIFHGFFSVCGVEKENKLLYGPKRVFFLLSLPVEKEIFIKKFVDSEFAIGETI